MGGTPPIRFACPGEETTPTAKGLSMTLVSMTLTVPKGLITMTLAVQVEDITNISLDSVTTISYIFGAGHRAPDITAGGEKIGLI